MDEIVSKSKIVLREATSNTGRKPDNQRGLKKYIKTGELAAAPRELIVLAFNIDTC